MPTETWEASLTVRRATHLSTPRAASCADSPSARTTCSTVSGPVSGAIRQRAPARSSENPSEGSRVWVTSTTVSGRS